MKGTVAHVLENALLVLGIGEGGGVGTTGDHCDNGERISDCTVTLSPTYLGVESHGK